MNNDIIILTIEIYIAGVNSRAGFATATLPKQLCGKALHTKKSSFMAEKWIRQLGKPRIGFFFRIELNQILFIVRSMPGSIFLI